MRTTVSFPCDLIRRALATGRSPAAMLDRAHAIAELINIFNARDTNQAPTPLEVELTQSLERATADLRAVTEERDHLAAHWRADSSPRMTQDKYEPPRVAREFARYAWDQHGMVRETAAQPGDWAWCSVADILAFEDERAGMIARIEVLEQQAAKGRPEKIVMPRYLQIDLDSPDVAMKCRQGGFNNCIAQWFRLNPDVETVPAPEVKP